MFGSYLKIAFRNLSKRKGYSLLNIFGLAIGITCCLLIFQYVSFERSYDRFPEKKQTILFVYVWILTSRENFPGSRQQSIRPSAPP